MGSSLTIKELITSWGFKVDDKALDGLDDKVQRLQSSIKWVGGLALGAAGAIFGLGKSASDAGDRAAKAAQRLGLSVTAFQEFSWAAQSAGVEAGTFEVALKKLAKNNKSGKSTEAYLLAVADRLDGITDASARMRKAQEIFGRDGGAMINVLAGGSKGVKAAAAEARELGLVMSEDAVRGAVAFDDALDRAKGAVTGLRNAIGVSLFPMLTRLTARFTHWVTTNRRWLALKVDRAVAVLTDFVERAVAVFERAARSANAVVESLGGWERAARFVTSAMVALLALRLVSFLGQLGLVIGKAVFAFRLLGKAGLVAQMKMAAIPLAIGAAFVALLLILEDVVAYFQGRKSITGLMVKDFDAFNDKLDAWIDNVLEKFKAFGVGVGKSIVDGIAGMQTADWEKVGNFLLSALSIAFKLSTLPLQIGAAIAEGIIEGLVAGLKARFPKLADFLGMNEDEGAAAGKDKGAAAAEKKPWYKSVGAMLTAPQVAIPATIIDTVANGLGKLNDALGLDELRRKTSLPATHGGGPIGPLSAPAAASTAVNVNAPITVNVPAGTPPEAVAGAARAGVKDSLDSLLRETGRATTPAVSY